MNIKFLVFISICGLFMSVVSAEESQQATIDAFKVCVKTALDNGTASDQVAMACEAEKTALDEQVPHLSDQILSFLIGNQ